MRRTKETFVTNLNTLVPLSDMRILEIGCGSGNYTRQLAQVCREIMAIDPDQQAIEQAKRQTPDQNIVYQVALAEELADIPSDFDMAIFTLSLHHVPEKLMAKAIDQAIAKVKPKGYIVFLEPTESGSFFDAEITFDACDGDERVEKSAAYKEMKHHQGLVEMVELSDQTEFHWDSIEDFLSSMQPKKQISLIHTFLQQHQFTLLAERRINIFRLNPPQVK